MPVPARNVAKEVGDSTSLELLARAGLTAYGAIHILVGWLALLMAWGAAGESSDLSGALGTVAKQPLGKVGLWLVTTGLLALALWHHFLYSDTTPPALLALFTEAIGNGYVRLLEDLGIESVWYDDGDWFGSKGAIRLALANTQEGTE